MDNIWVFYMDNIWVYAGAGLAGLLWGMGYVQPAVVAAFLAGVWVGAGNDVIKWAVIALIAGYVIGSIIAGRKKQV